MMPPRRQLRVPPERARFLTLEQVAAELGVTMYEARRLVSTGELPAIRIGGRGVWRVERTVIERRSAGARPSDTG